MPKILLTCGLSRSASTSSTDRSRSRARLNARLMLVKVLPSPGNALDTMMSRDSPAAPVVTPDSAVLMSGRLI